MHGNPGGIRGNEGHLPRVTTLRNLSVLCPSIHEKLAAQGTGVLNALSQSQLSQPALQPGLQPGRCHRFVEKVIGRFQITEGYGHRSAPALKPRQRIRLADDISRGRPDGDGHPLEADQRTGRDQPHLQVCHDIPSPLSTGLLIRLLRA